MIEIDPALLRRALAGDPDAHEQALALLPKEGNLFGRWATHPEVGRVLCGSVRPDLSGDVRIVAVNKKYADGTAWHWASLDSLTFDPVELVTEQGFRDAPEGTIVTADDSYPLEKRNGAWRCPDVGFGNIGMETTGPWQVVRWGEGAQA